MSVLKIIEYGSPILRNTSKEVSKVSKKIKNLVYDMLDTMYSANGVGLAAPQVGENLRIFVIDVSDPSGPVDPMVFINPKIIKKSGAINSYEGCLSFPGIYANVLRPEWVKIEARNEKGGIQIFEGEGYTARAFLHEMDHLNGKLFIDYLSNLKRNLIKKKISKNTGGHF